MFACHGCHRHVRIDELACPFCGASLSSSPAPAAGRTAVLVATLGLTTFACATRPVDDLSDESSTTAESTSTETTTDTTMTTVTTVGDGDGDPNDDWSEEASAYAGPDDWGDGDGDPGDGDGDPPAIPCADYAIGPVELGSNEVVIIDSPSLLEASCGANGPEAVHQFVAPSEGFYAFELTDAEFADWSLYLVGDVCSPLDELACSVNEAVPQDLLEGQLVHVVIDVPAGSSGTANLEIIHP